MALSSPTDSAALAADERRNFGRTDVPREMRARRSCVKAKRSRRFGECDASRRGRAGRAREARRRGRSELARLARQLHGGRGGRDRAAEVNERVIAEGQRRWSILKGGTL